MWALVCVFSGNWFVFLVTIPGVIFQGLNHVSDLTCGKVGHSPWAQSIAKKENVIGIKYKFIPLNHDWLT